MPGRKSRATAAPSASVSASVARWRVNCMAGLLRCEVMQTKQSVVPTGLAELAQQIRAWAVEFGFQHIGIADADLSQAEPRLLEWLHAGFHGDMDYMAKHGVKRARPGELVPGTLRVIAARMNYLPAAAAESWPVINSPDKAYVSRYALGRDYHKVLRRRLQRLVERVELAVGRFGHRVFTDSAPGMEVELAQKAGLGWRGKHARLLGSAIHRIGYACWLRNLAVGMGNALRALPATSSDAQRIIAALRARCEHESALVREHVAWALQQQATI